MTDIGSLEKHFRMSFHPILPHNKLDLSIHVFVVNGFTELPVDSSSGLPRLLVSTRPTETVEQAFGAHNPVEDTHSSVDVTRLHDHCPTDELLGQRWAPHQLNRQMHDRLYRVLCGQSVSKRWLKVEWQPVVYR